MQRFFLALRLPPHEREAVERMRQELRLRSWQDVAVRAYYRFKEEVLGKGVDHVGGNGEKA